jgi:hypothetical protein
LLVLEPEVTSNLHLDFLLHPLRSALLLYASTKQEQQQIDYKYERRDANPECPVMRHHKVRFVAYRCFNVIQEPALLRLLLWLERCAKSMEDVLAFEITVVGMVVDRYGWVKYDTKFVLKGSVPGKDPVVSFRIAILERRRNATMNCVKIDAKLAHCSLCTVTFKYRLVIDATQPHVIHVVEKKMQVVPCLPSFYPLIFKDLKYTSLS